MLSRPCMTSAAFPIESGDRGAFEATVLPLRPSLYGRALQLCRDPQQAEDLVQETVLRAWRFWPRFREGSNCKAWLRTILLRNFINTCRKRTRERDLLDAIQGVAALEAGTSAATVTSPTTGVDDRFGDEVLRALETLPAAQRQVLELVDVEGLSYQDAAARVQRPVGTIMSRLHRARRHLREELAAYAAEQGMGPARV